MRFDRRICAFFLASPPPPILIFVWKNYKVSSPSPLGPTSFISLFVLRPTRSVGEGNKIKKRKPIDGDAFRRRRRWHSINHPHSPPLSFSSHLIPPTPLFFSSPGCRRTSNLPLPNSTFVAAQRKLPVKLSGFVFGKGWERGVVRTCASVYITPLSTIQSPVAAHTCRCYYQTKRLPARKPIASPDATAATRPSLSGTVNGARTLYIIFSTSSPVLSSVPPLLPVFVFFTLMITRHPLPQYNSRTYPTTGHGDRSIV